MGRAPHGGPLSYLCQGTLSVRAAQMSGLVSIPSLPLPSSQRGVLHHTESGKGTGAPADPRVLLLLGLGLSLSGSPQVTRTQWLPLTRHGHSLDGPGRRGSGGPRGGRHPCARASRQAGRQAPRSARCSLLRVSHLHSLPIRGGLSVLLTRKYTVF